MVSARLQDISVRPVQIVPNCACNQNQDGGLLRTIMSKPPATPKPRITVPLCPRAFSIIEKRKKASRRSMGQEAALIIETALLQKP
jgi:hypothetical protein